MIKTVNNPPMFVCLFVCLLCTVHKVIQIYVARTAQENEILHEIFRVVSRFPRKISCYISENRLSLGQCIAMPCMQTAADHLW